jgi:cytochrome c-type biogenesis protein CcsB
LRFRFSWIFALAIGFATDQLCARAPLADTSRLDFKQFGLLAIQDGGRRKPVDTFARETLIRITGRSTYTDKAGRQWEPNDFVLSAMLETHDWKNEPMVLISLGELKERLGLEKTERRFSFAQLVNLSGLQQIANAAHAKKRAEKPLDRVEQEALSVSDRLALLAHVMDGSAFLVVPAPKNETDPWAEPQDWSKYYSQPQFDSAQNELKNTATAYVDADGFKFSRASNQLREDLRALSPSVYPQDRQLRLEYFYNHFEAFNRAVTLYGIALLILLSSYWPGAPSALRVFGVIAVVVGLPARILVSGLQQGFIKWLCIEIPTGIVLILLSFLAQNSKGQKILRILAVASAVVGLGFHASGIVMRCMIAGRPPVTNMYESIIWVSFAVSFFGMIFFARYRTPVYLLAALPVTLTALLLVFEMPIAMPASIDPLVPVLRDNFWLTVHVLTITLSYAAFALAMGFGHILLYRYAKNPAGARADQPMHFWLYRVLQLGVILLAAGTILGGVWANYSWGRFWGWDPKETWALIALLCYILTLHGRLAGWWTQFGLVVASVVCFLAVLMAWYGVNFVLGKGLHSYGFGIGGETYVATFVALDLLFVIFAIWRYRASKRALAPAAEIGDEPVIA